MLICQKPILDVQSPICLIFKGDNRGFVFCFLESLDKVKLSIPEMKNEGSVFMDFYLSSVSGQAWVICTSKKIYVFWLSMASMQKIDVYFGSFSPKPRWQSDKHRYCFVRSCFMVQYKGVDVCVCVCVFRRGNKHTTVNYMTHTHTLKKKHTDSNSLKLEWILFCGAMVGRDCLTLSLSNSSANEANRCISTGSFL